MKKKILAMALVLVMVFAMLPAGVLAAPVSESAAPLTAATVGKLEPSAVAPNAKSYAVSLSGGSHGTVELLVDSPVQAGSEVYFLADPDDGYLAYIYYDGLEVDDIVYLGAEMFGFIMPANKVTLEVEFVEAEGEEHSISVYDGGSSAGQYALSRESAKAGESVLLGVYPNHSGDFDPLELVWAFGADVYYLFEDSGIFYFEIIMSDEDVKILLAYSYLFSYKVNFESFIMNGDVSASVKTASTGTEVLVYATPDPGYLVKDVRVKTDEGGIYLDLSYVGEENGAKVYSFIMPPSKVTVDADFYADTRNVTVKAGPGGTASANVTQPKVGDTVTVTCKPNDNYRVYTITGADGIQDNGNNTYSFVMPARDVTINVTFKTIYNPVTVTVETGLGGTASVDLAKAKAGDTVTLTCAPEEGYRIARITGADVIDNGDNTYSFTMPDGPVELKVLFLRHENPFLDVNETQFFYESVLWAAENGITSGISETEFDPAGSCIRAQVVTFLWRYAGSPEPTTQVNPFTDVPADSWFAKPVLWAVENGITTGVSDTEFGPGLSCNRAQVVTFLWRFMGQPGSTIENSFEDVEKGSWYEQPVLWAAQNGITTGTDATHFNPAGPCLRAQVVTFLYRTAQLPAVYNLHWNINGFTDTPSDYGTVTLSHTSAQAGEVITATVIPAEGWQLDWAECYYGTKVTQVSDTEYTFVMPDHEEIFCVNFSEIPVEPDPTEPTEPDPTEPDPTEPEQPVKTYTLDLRTNGSGTVAYVDGQMTAAPGESIFFYAVPNEGYYLDHVGIFNPDGTIDVSTIVIEEYGDGLYELIMIPHDLIMTCYFYPIA